MESSPAARGVNLRDATYPCEDQPMKPSFTGQQSVPATDRKFHPKDEHLIAESKEDVNKINHGAKLEPEPGQHRYKFADMDRDSKSAKE
jgi:hypothetical protein